MSRLIAPRILAASVVLLALGIGCGSAGGGGGCAGLAPLPSDPAPLGFPTDQLIEGGMQARITKPGMDKLVATIPALFQKMLGAGFNVPIQSQSLSIVGTIYECSSSCGGGSGCPVTIILSSADGKDRILVTLQDGDSATGNPPIITVDATFDVHVPIDISYDPPLISCKSVCTLDTHSAHFTDPNADPIHIVANIVADTDPTTGELTLHLANTNGLQILNLGIQFSDCGVVSSILSTVTDAINGVITSFIGQFIINLLRPQIDALLQSFLPKPLGLAGVINPATLLAKFSPPADAHLETFVVPGGYVASSSGGLTLGVMSGMNSDRDESTRSPGLSSEPSLCVPARPTPDLSAQPWMLPYNAPRKDFMLSRAGEFSGMPDPVDSTGALEDVAIGISRTFLDLAGFHIYNSGTMCLSIGGDALPQLNAGTLSVVVGSLGNILEDRKAPLALVLRPQTPLSFTIGAGDMADPLLHIVVSDLRIDFYAWVEERYVRIFTLGMDLNVGLNLTITKDPAGNPALQPTLSGIDAQHVTIRVSNTDLLQEDPAALASVFPSLINIATGALGGALKPIPLPSVAGFSLSQLAIRRVQTTQDDFLGIFGDIVTGSPAPLIDWSDPQHPKVVGELQTTAVVDGMVVPKEADLQAMFKSGQPIDPANKPRVTLRLGVENSHGQRVEWGYRIDGGIWHDWSQNPEPTIADDAFLLQGRHLIEVRSRIVNQWTTEDSTPSKLEVLIDSVPPEIHAALDPDHPDVLDFNGFDIVSDAKALTYAWIGADGQRTPWTSEASMTLADAERLTDGASKPLVLFAKDEAGNVAEQPVDLNGINGFHGRTTNPPASGCGCTIGGANQDSGAGALYGALLVLGLLVLLRRRRAQVALVLALFAIGLHAAGCGCDDKGRQCSIDDDCAKMQCAAGQIPQCQSQMCVCSPDLSPGDVGRFSSMTMIGSDAYIAAYNNTYGDLMIGHITPPGVVSDWDFVDGVPDTGPDVVGSHVRGGIMENGDDVGRYTSIQTTQAGDPVIAYYDGTHGSLKFASFGVIRWHSHVVDPGTLDASGNGDDLGRWASMTIGPDGRPAIAYTATVEKGMSGMPEGQLRWAQANVPDPQQTSDWTITVVDARPLPAAGGAMSTPDGGVADGGMAGTPDGGAAPAMSEPLLPEGIGLMASAARMADGTPGIAYYDRTRGNLRYVAYNASANMWDTPVILDGEDAMGNDTADVGMYPSLTYDPKGVGYISYVDATHDNLLFVDTQSKTPEVVDDGYRSDDEQTLDGLPSPVYHLVGDSSSIQTDSGQVVIAYQDSTVEQLRLAQRGIDGKWMLSTIAGHATPFKGSYGFYADLRLVNGKAVISSYAINQHLESPLFYVEVFAQSLGLIM